MTNTTQAQRNRANRSTARIYIEAREAFKTHTGNVSGKWVDSMGDANDYYSRLPREHRATLADHLGEGARAGRSTYVVYSYLTPIAWWSQAYGWHRPRVSYSPSTGQHQGMCPWGTVQLAEIEIERAEIDAYREARARRSAQLAAEREAREARKAQRLASV